MLAYVTLPDALETPCPLRTSPAVDRDAADQENAEQEVRQGVHETGVVRRRWVRQPKGGGAASLSTQRSPDDTEGGEPAVVGSDRVGTVPVIPP